MHLTQHSQRTNVKATMAMFGSGDKQTICCVFRLNPKHNILSGFHTPRYDRNDCVSIFNASQHSLSQVKAKHMLTETQTVRQGFFRSFTTNG